MAKRVQHVRYTNAALSVLVGYGGELIVNTTNNALTVHDGATPGGFAQALADLSNSPVATSSVAGKMSAAQATSLAGMVDVLVDIADLQTDKADKVVPAITDTLATLDASGNLGSSGMKPFPAGTQMLFRNTAPPSGWSVVAVDDSVLRCHSTSFSSGGSTSITSNHVHSTSPHVLTIGQMPQHSHIMSFSNSAVFGGNPLSDMRDTPTTSDDIPTSNQGNNEAHSHGSTSSLPAYKYVDILLAVKD